MTVTLCTNLPAPEGTQDEPCLCAQMAETFRLMVTEGQDTPEIRADLKAAADPGCRMCGGSGIEKMPVLDPYTYQLNEGNAHALLGALGLAQQYGECSIAEARRALVRARNTNLAPWVRESETVYGAPCEREDGVVEARPLRVFSPGLSAAQLKERIDRFEAFLHAVVAAGATSIRWG